MILWLCRLWLSLLSLASVSRGEHEEEIVFVGLLSLTLGVNGEFRNAHNHCYIASAHDPEDIWGPTFFYANGQYYGQTLCSDGHGPATSGRDCEVTVGIRNLETPLRIKTSVAGL